MLFYCRKRKVAAYILLTLLAATLFFFRDRLLLSFQVWRLEKLGCGTAVVSNGRTPGRLTPCPKLWAHRVNSEGRFQKLGKRFAGLETDVVFDPVAGTFDIHHPPKPPSGLLLDSFLSQLSGTGLRLWIDLKDLQAGDVPAAVAAFVAYDQRYRIRENILVESSLPEFANALAEKGFSASLLVSPAYLEQGGYGTAMPPALSPQVGFVSQDVRYLEKLKNLYPDRKIITWSLAFHNYIDRSALQSLMADTAVAVILINVKSSPYH